MTVEPGAGDDVAMSEPARLPPASTEQDFAAIAGDEVALRPGVEALCRRLALDPSTLVRFTTGSLPVYAAGDAVLKLFPPLHAHEQPVEAGVLTALHGRLPIPTPPVRAAGEHDGWRYVLMDHLPGADLSHQWPRLDQVDRAHLAAQAGALAAALHRVEPPRIDGAWPEDWAAFVTAQRASAVERHRGWGLAAPWLEQMPAFLAALDLAPRTPPGSEPLVLLHTEVMPANLLARRDERGGWRLSGLVDLEPALVGQREYELVAVAIFLAEGDPVVFGAALTGYGYAADQLGEAFRRRMMAWTLLHRCGNVASYLERLPAPAEPAFEALADRWFAVQAAR